MDSGTMQDFVRRCATTNQVSAAKDRVLWSRHAIVKLAVEELTRERVEHALAACDVIEVYPVVHRPLPDCLALAWLVAQEPLHLVIAVDVSRDRIYVVTLYRPDSRRWENGWRIRKP